MRSEDVSLSEVPYGPFQQKWPQLFCLYHTPCHVTALLPSEVLSIIAYLELRWWHVLDNGMWQKEQSVIPSWASPFLCSGSRACSSLLEGFPGGSVVKNPSANAGGAGSISGSGRSPGKGNGNSLQYSCQRNPLDRGAWWAAVHEFAKELDTT